MATYTENYNLEKPAQSDLYNIGVFNENADKIDEALGDKAENQSLAPIESSATASRNYSVGQQFVYNGLLYEATSAIASGGTITPGSNCARTTVAEELSALNDSLANETIWMAFVTENFTFYTNSVRHVTVTPTQLGLSGNIQALMTAVNVNDSNGDVLAVCSNYISGVGIRLTLRSFESAAAEHSVTVSLLYKKENS